MPLQQGSAALSASSVMSITASTSVDLGALWAIYLAAETEAARLTELYVAYRQAGGYSAGAGAAYSAAYIAQTASAVAYASWLAAYQQFNTSPPSEHSGG